MLVALKEKHAARSVAPRGDDMSNWSAIIATCIALAAMPCRGEGRLIRLVSLEWQPYAGAGMSDQGASAAVVKAAFQAMGYSVDIDFYPWARAVRLTESANEYDGIFPMYFSAARDRWLNCSGAIGRGPLGFAERSVAPVVWSKLDDLTAYKIGVVRDYVNTEAFDAMVAAGRVDVDAVGSDVQNLQKLAHGRIDLAVIDRNVFDYLQKVAPKESSKDEQADAAALRFNKRLLENKPIYVCFKRNATDDRVAAVFDAGLHKIDADAIVEQYMQALKRR